MYYLKRTLKKSAFAAILAFGVHTLGMAQAPNQLNATGPVGIGTSSPQQQLHVVGNARYEGNVEFVGDHYLMNEIGSTSQGFIRFFSNGTPASSQLIFNGGTNPLRFDSNLKMNGGVVVTNQSDEAVLKFENANQFGLSKPFSVWKPLFLRGPVSAPQLFTQTDMNLSFGNYNNPANFHFGLSVGDGYGNQTELMRVQKDGKVGIGTDNPRALLDVDGDAAVTGNLQGYTSPTDPNGKFHIYAGSWVNDGPYIAMHGQAEQYNPGEIVFAAKDGVGSSTSRAFTFLTKVGPNCCGTSDFEEHMVIQRDGKVGIGTPSPDYELDVAGTIRACEVKVNLNSSWCDYVFEDDYELMSLSDLETYVQKEKHLPKIPAASVVEAQGLEVADMQIKMMEKIEELTLYVIDLNKQNEQLQAEINLLKEEK